MSARPERPLSRDRAWACVTLNFTLSGLGSLKAGRRFTGISQLVTVFGGFFLLLAWMLKWIYRIFQAQIGETLSPPPAAWLWQLGIAGFAISYVWMLLTCASLMRQARAQENETAKTVPPRLADMPGKPPKLPKNPVTYRPPVRGSGMEKITADQIQSALAALPDWQRKGEIISRTFQFKDFPAAMSFVNAVAELAEQAQHHPDLDIRWNKVTLALTTHDAGGLTEKDFAMAKQCDVLAVSH